MTHYDVIERAIHYLNENYKSQPSLEQVAGHVGLSPYHFQRIFYEWAGVSPKKYLQYLSLEQAKGLLRQDHSLLATSLDVGLSGPSRLHDLFVTIESMTPGDYKNGAYGLTINYSLTETQFGPVIIASTARGICYLAFYATEQEGVNGLRSRFPQAQIVRSSDPAHTQVVDFLTSKLTSATNLKLHLKGTPFQLKVWEALLQLPVGSVATYADIAQAIEHPRSVRAVGNAVGANPVAYIIPCHRVIRASGVIGGYRWGTARKQAMLGWETIKGHTGHQRNEPDPVVRPRGITAGSIRIEAAPPRYESFNPATSGRVGDQNHVDPHDP